MRRPLKRKEREARRTLAATIAENRRRVRELQEVAAKVDQMARAMAAGHHRLLGNPLA